MKWRYLGLLVAIGVGLMACGVGSPSSTTRSSGSGSNSGSSDSTSDTTSDSTDATSDATETTDAASTAVTFLVEAIPGSTHHSQDGTWWGYHQSKIVRYGTLVFMYVIDNADQSVASRFTIYKKEGDGDWTKGADFPTSRPGNLVIDSSGVLHAFVFEPTTFSTNDSIGKLQHYTFAQSAAGDISTYTTETIIDNNGSTETVNIRVGAAIGANGTMAVAFGLTTNADGQTEQVYSKGTANASWTQSVAGTNLGHDYYYPYTLVTSEGFALLPIQDDFVSANENNIYQKISVFEQSGGTWTQRVLVDHTSHALAATRRRLLEQSDLYQDSSGNLHVLYKEYLDSSEASTVSAMQYHVKRSGVWETSTIDRTAESINWMSLLEVDGVMYAILSASATLYVCDLKATALTQLIIPSDISGIYPYVAAPRGGTRSTEDYVDLLLLNGQSSDYPSAKNYYVRIPKSEFAKVQ